MQFSAHVRAHRGTRTRNASDVVRIAGIQRDCGEVRERREFVGAPLVDRRLVLALPAAVRGRPRLGVRRVETVEDARERELAHKGARETRRGPQLCAESAPLPLGTLQRRHERRRQRARVARHAAQLAREREAPGSGHVAHHVREFVGEQRKRRH